MNGRIARLLLVGGLLIGVAAMQHRLWVGRDSLAEVHALALQRDALAAELEVMRQRNRVIAADIQDLRRGSAALESRARSELGLVRRDEILFRFVPAGS